MILSEELMTGLVVLATHIRVWVPILVSFPLAFATSFYNSFRRNDMIRAAALLFWDLSVALTLCIVLGKSVYFSGVRHL